MSSATNSKPVLAYWKCRGFGQHLRLLLSYLGTDYENKMYEFGPGPAFDKESWLSDKFQLGLDFPNVPYWIDGDVKLTESKAIFKYLTSTRGAALLPATPQLQATADMLEGVLNDLQQSLVTYSYAPVGSIPTSPDVSNAAKFEQLVAFLGANTWALGSKLSYIDFFMYEVLYQFRRFQKGTFKSYPLLEKYMYRFECLPQLAACHKSGEDLTVYSPHGTILY